MIRPVVIATMLAACVTSLPVSAETATHTTVSGAHVEVTSDVNKYISAVRRQDKSQARALLIDELRQLRDDLRDWALVSRGGNFKDEQAAIIAVLKSVKDQIAKLKAGQPAVASDSEDSGALDPILFELQGY